MRGVTPSHDRSIGLPLVLGGVLLVLILALLAVVAHQPSALSLRPRTVIVPGVLPRATDTPTLTASPTSTPAVVPAEQINPTATRATDVATTTPLATTTPAMAATLARPTRVPRGPRVLPVGTEENGATASVTPTTP